MRLNWPQLGSRSISRVKYNLTQQRKKKLADKIVPTLDNGRRYHIQTRSTDETTAKYKRNFWKE